MYSNEGKRIKNVLEIPDDINYLLVSETKKFRDILRMEPFIDTNYRNHYALK